MACDLVFSYYHFLNFCGLLGYWFFAMLPVSGKKTFFDFHLNGKFHHKLLVINWFKSDLHCPPYVSIFLIFMWKPSRKANIKIARGYGYLTNERPFLACLLNKWLMVLTFPLFNHTRSGRLATSLYCIWWKLTDTFQSRYNPLFPKCCYLVVIWTQEETFLHSISLFR